MQATKYLIELGDQLYGYDNEVLLRIDIAQAQREGVGDARIKLYRKTTANFVLSYEVIELSELVPSPPKPVMDDVAGFFEN